MEMGIGYEVGKKGDFLWPPPLNTMQVWNSEVLPDFLHAHVEQASLDGALCEIVSLNSLRRGRKNEVFEPGARNGW